VSGRSASPFIEIPYEVKVEEQSMLFFCFRECILVGHRPFDPLVVAGPWLRDSFSAALLFFLRGSRLEQQKKDPCELCQGHDDLLLKIRSFSYTTFLPNPREDLWKVIQGRRVSWLVGEKEDAGCKRIAKSEGKPGHEYLSFPIPDGCGGFPYMIPHWE